MYVILGSCYLSANLLPVLRNQRPINACRLFLYGTIKPIIIKRSPVTCSCFAATFAQNTGNQRRIWLQRWLQIISFILTQSLLTRKYEPLLVDILPFFLTKVQSRTFYAPFFPEPFILSFDLVQTRWLLQNLIKAVFKYIKIGYCVIQLWRCLYNGGHYLIFNSRWVISCSYREKNKCREHFQRVSTLNSSDALNVHYYGYCMDSLVSYVSTIRTFTRSCQGSTRWQGVVAGQTSLD